MIKLYGRDFSNGIPMPSCLNFYEYLKDTIERIKKSMSKFVGRDGSEYEVFDKKRFEYSLYFSRRDEESVGSSREFSFGVDT